MSIPDIQHRLHRIYGAIGKTVVLDFAEHKTAAGGDTYFFYFNQVRGPARSQIDIENDLFSAIANIANLKDYLKDWIKRHSGDPKKVEDHVNGSFDLQIIVDLHNLEKHASRDRPSRSGRNPR